MNDMVSIWVVARSYFSRLKVSRSFFMILIAAVIGIMKKDRETFSREK